MKFMTAEVEVKVDDSKLSSQLAKAKRLVLSTVSRIKSSFKGMAAAFKSAFTKMVRIAKLAMAAITLTSIKAFASFDDAMQKSVAIMTGVTVELRKELEKTALSISKNSVKSATELAQSYFFLASAGLSVEQSLKALIVVEAFAVAGAFDMALATDLVTDAQSALGLTVKDSTKNMKNMKRITDVLIGANTLANASTQQFSEALMRAGPAMKAYNIKLEEGVAVLAAYADQGMKGVVGGELFGRMLKLLIKGFTENEMAWKRFGISIVDANDKMRPMADIVRDLTGLLDGMGVTQKSRTLDMLGFAARTQATILPLLGAGDAIEDYNKKLNDMGGITQRVRDFQLKSFASQMKIVWNNIVSIGIVIGRKLAPHIEALGNMLRDNRDVIEGWATSFVDRVLYIKNILWAFVKFLHSDWKKGIKVGLDVSLVLFKGFGKSLIVVMEDIASKAWRAFVKEFGEGLGMWLVQASRPEGVLGKALSMTPIGLGMAKSGLGLIKSARKPQQDTGPSIGEQLKDVWKETAADIKNIIPSELSSSLTQPFVELKEELKEVKETINEAQEAMENAFVETPKRQSEAMRKFTEGLQEWAGNAKNIWKNLGDVAVRALDRTADALTDLVLKGKADFNALAESILEDMTRMIIKALMAQALGVFMGGIGGGGGGGMGIPSAQHGGEVQKTGLAVIHKGETYSGVQGGQRQQGGNTINVNVSAIDAAGTFQFLKKNKRNFATMVQGEMGNNHPSRRSQKYMV